MRVLSSTYGSRGDVEPLVGLAVRLRALGTEVRVCASPDKEFAELLAGVGVPLVPVGRPVRPLVTGATPPSAADAPRRAAELVAAAADPTPTTESLSAALRTTLTPETRARATAVAGTIRTDGTTVAATLLVNAVSRERPPVSA